MGDGAKADPGSHDAHELFDELVGATTCRATLRAFGLLCDHLGVPGGGEVPGGAVPGDPRQWPFYHTVKHRLNYWKAKDLWVKIDKRASHKDYQQRKACAKNKVTGSPMT